MTARVAGLTANRPKSMRAFPIFMGISRVVGLVDLVRGLRISFKVINLVATFSAGK